MSFCSYSVGDSARASVSFNTIAGVLAIVARVQTLTCSGFCYSGDSCVNLGSIQLRICVLFWRLVCSQVKSDLKNKIELDKIPCDRK